MALVERKINVTFQLGKGTVGETGMDTVKVTGLRVICNIVNAGGPSMGQATLRISGLSLSLMNQLAYVMKAPTGNIEVRFNGIVIEAGDDLDGMKIVFQGTIVLSQIDFSNAPEVVLNVVAHAGAYQAVQSTPPYTSSVSVDAADIMAKLAAASNPPLEFKNYGVSIMIKQPYYGGSIRNQMRTCAEDNNFCWTIWNNKLEIWPFGTKTTSDNDTIIISPETGLIGYPTNYQYGVNVQMLFNPLLKMGGKVNITSLLPFACGDFLAFGLTHEISSEVPGGPWLTSFHGIPFNV